MYAIRSYYDYEAPAEEATTECATTETTQIYRGITISQTAPKATESATLAHRKSRRIYRGQVLES